MKSVGILMSFFNLFKAKDTKKVSFSAQVIDVMKQTRLNSSIVICEITEGSLNTNDTVSLLDANKKVITEGKVSEIDHQQKGVCHIEKSNTDSNYIGLVFYDICDKPIENSKYICKI